MVYFIFVNQVFNNDMTKMAHNACMMGEWTSYHAKDKEQVDGVLPSPPTSTPGGGDVARKGDAGEGESGSLVEAASKKVKKKQGKKR